jgi:hypothetical protein
MNITLSVDDKAIESARQRAKALGSSVNQLVREYPNNLRAKATPSRMRAEFEKLSGLRTRLARLEIRPRECTNNSD